MHVCTIIDIINDIFIQRLLVPTRVDRLVTRFPVNTCNAPLPNSANSFYDVAQCHISAIYFINFTYFWMQNRNTYH